MSVKLPDRLVGFITDKKGDRCPFEFEYNGFHLLVYPASYDSWVNSSDPITLSVAVGEDGRKAEWVSRIEIRGVTFNQYTIVFFVRDLATDFHGFLSYNVEWFYYCPQSFPLDEICGFKILGPEVDSFYPSGIALEKEIKYPTEGKAMITVSSSECSTASDCGEYTIDEDLDVSISLETMVIMSHNDAERPIGANSLMVFNFSRPVGLETLVKTAHQSNLFYKYVCYRTNITFKPIEAFHYIDGKRYPDGLLVFSKSTNEEERSGRKRIIDFSVLGKKTAEVFTAIGSDQLAFGHLCDSVEGKRLYTPGRMIMIMANFEREFRNLYGQAAGRSNEYKEVKDEILKQIDAFQVTQHGKKKKSVKEFQRLISTHDNSYSQNVKKALDDCYAIMSPFIHHHYPGDILGSIEGICKRAGEIRNGIAHLKMDFDLDPVHIRDIKIMEELTYAIRLRKMGIDDDAIIRGIKQLFHENIAI